MVVCDGEEYEGVHDCEADVGLIDPCPHRFQRSDTDRRSSQPELSTIKTCQEVVGSGKKYGLTCSVVVATIVREGERLQ